MLRDAEALLRREVTFGRATETSPTKEIFGRGETRQSLRGARSSKT